LLSGLSTGKAAVVGEGDATEVAGVEKFGATLQAVSGNNEEESKVRRWLDFIEV
jgi:hypothetical protein